MIIEIATPQDKQKVADYIDRLPDKKFTVKIERKKENRSISQNALYWSWLNLIMAETGNHKDDLHEDLGKKFLPRFVRVYNDEEKEIVRSTKHLCTVEFADYLKRVQEFSASWWGVRLPDPDERIFEEFYSQYQNYI